MQVYAAIIAGIIVGYGYLISIDNPSIEKPITDYLVLCILLFLVVLTFVGFFLTLRWAYSFECHRKKVNEIASILWLSCNVVVPLDPTMEIPPLHIMPPRLRKTDGIFRTRYWFPLFYLFVLIVILALINWPLNLKGCKLAQPGILAVSIFIIAVSIFITYRGFNSIRKLNIEKRVILAGCNGEWAQERYLPFLIEQANSGDITLWATDIQSEIKLNSHRSHSLWQTAKSNGKACYLDMTKGVESYEIPWNVDYVFIVTPDRCHCEVAEFWLSRLSTDGKIFIEKPLDASIEAAERLKAKILNNNVVYGFDHYLAELHPFLRGVRSYLRRIGEPESLEVKILENAEIPFKKVNTLKEGVIFDLFPHVLAVSAAVVEKKLAPTEAIFQTVALKERALAKYKGWPFSSETYARIKFLIGDRRVSVSGMVGKGIGETSDKQMVIHGTRRRKIEIDFQAHSVNGKKRKLESKHVESFLEAVLAGSCIDSAPGVLSFNAAFAILKLLLDIRNNTDMEPKDYDIGTSPP
ncbi:MAG: Gfo/Idh/MocA family oxidoreductase [Dehalococcoidia bacterium]